VTNGGGSDVPRELLARLARLLEERQELLDRVGRVATGQAAATPEVCERLERLAREQERVIAELTLLLPPDEPPMRDVRPTDR
jgi:hypothetical protein